MSDTRLLLRLWLTKPRQIATWTPTGTAVAQAYVDALDAAPRDGHIVELGAGTGPITGAMIDAGCDRSRLCIVEYDHALVVLLKQRFGHTGIVQGDARALGALFDAHGIDRVAAIVSTLPILHFSRTDQKRVLDGCFSRALPGATFTQITYLPGSPIRQRALSRWGYCARRFKRVNRNWPPATLWQYQPASAD
jgi:phosphatidylethanolamine/phosphatidyl-N-methylethanolamine N-methyltransferase